jgi:DNA-binding MarR family transcriptional regulator
MKKAGKSVDSSITWGELVVTIFRLNSLFLSIGNDISKPAKQTSARWQILGSVYSQNQTVAQIARRMGLTRQSVQRIADVLSKEGFTRYLENIDHKKSKLLSITDAGRVAMQRIVEEQRKWASLWSTKISKPDLERTLTELHRIEEICQLLRP